MTRTSLQEQQDYPLGAAEAGPPGFDLGRMELRVLKEVRQVETEKPQRSDTHELAPSRPVAGVSLKSRNYKHGVTLLLLH